MRTGARGPLRVFLAALTAALVGVAVFAGTAWPRANDAPKTTSPPAIEGTPVVGQTLGATTGGWLNGPTAYAYQWQRCDQNAANCQDLAGETDNNYTVKSADAGNTLRVLVTASNSDGKSTANSHPTSVVSANGVAQNTARPTISGTPTVGSTLTANKGTWNSATSSWTYQWQDCDQNGNNCTDVAGAHGTTYGVRTSDVGHTIRVMVTGTGSQGKATSVSDRTNVVQAAAAATPQPAENSNPCSKLAASASNSTVSATDLSLPNRLVVSGIKFSPQAIQSRSTFTARFRVMDSCGRPVQNALVYVTALPFGLLKNAPEVQTDATGWATIPLTPTQRLQLTPGTHLQMFVRARKPGGDILAGISTRRLIQVGIGR